MNREKKLTKREQKALKGAGPGVAARQGLSGHIHCVACGRHIDPAEFEAPARALLMRCGHGKQFPSCVECRTTSQALLDEHDRTGRDVQPVAAWH